MGKAKVAPTDIKKTLEEKEKSDQAFAKVTTPKKGKKIVSEGRVFINTSFNNTIISVTDLKGDIIAWASAGSLGFSGPKKATPFASSRIVAAIAEKVKNFGLKDIGVIIKGVGSGRDSALRSLINQGFNILFIRDATPIPHNGPRPPKVRRV